MPSVQLLVTVITLSKPIPILLFAAWLAIFVSVILTFAPNIQQDVSAELSSKLEQIVKELDSIRQEIPKENEKNSSNKK